MSPMTPLILIADDDEEDYLFAHEAFVAYLPKTKVRWVKSGEELFDFLKGESQHPALLLVDLRMPRMDGFEVISEMKKHPAWKDIPIVALTGSTADADRETAKALGVDAFLTKPVGLESMSDIKGICKRFGIPA
jgi:two-component system response regulator